MKRSTAWFLVMTAVVAVMAVAVVSVAWLAVDRPLRPDGTVLEIDLQGLLPEHDPDEEVNALFGVRIVTLHDLIQAIDAAADDPRVLALQVRVGPLLTGWARAAEVRAALARFRASGKPVHAFLEIADDGTYYVASVADEVRLIPTGTLWLDGIRAEVPFYAGTLGKVGVRADLEQVGAYKNAADSMTRESMTDAHREAVTSLIDGLFDELVAGVAASRGATPEAVRAAISAGPYTAQQALEAGLVDALSYEDEAATALEEAIGRPDVARLDLGQYLATVRAPRGRRSIGIVYCAGTILPGRSSQGIFGDSTMGSDTISAAILEAWEEDGVDAIVLRVDSPGGSPVASDVIWASVMRAREEGVPVVVSMSDVAASGGYWISMGADHVVAGPSTITGSIGIYGGKYVTQGLNELVGLHVEPVQRGENAGINSTLSAFTDEQRAWMRDQLDSVYATFLQKAAEGRGFDSPEAVDEHARGRVWTGRQAVELGLVDELGDLTDAIRAARELAGIGPQEPVTIHEYPRPLGLIDTLFGTSSVGARRAAWRAALGRDLAAELPDDVTRFLSASRLLRQLRTEGAVAYMPYRVPAR